MKAHNPALHYLIPGLFILLAAFSRILPHPPNFTPVGAMALFGAAWFSKRYWAFIIPLASLWLSDLFLNNVVYTQYYPSFVWFETAQLWIYLSFALITLLGFALLGKKSIGRVALAGVSASVLFFLLTNFGVWISGGMYAPTWQGLVTCYAAAIPFFSNTLLGDLFYTAAMFGSFILLQQKFPQLLPQKLN